MESEIKEILLSIYECLEIVNSLIIRIQEKKDNINKSIDLVEKLMIEHNSHTHTNMKKKELNKQIIEELEKCMDFIPNNKELSDFDQNQILFKNIENHFVKHIEIINQVKKIYDINIESKIDNVFFEEFLESYFKCEVIFTNREDKLGILINDLDILYKKAETIYRVQTHFSKVKTIFEAFNKSKNQTKKFLLEKVHITSLLRLDFFKFDKNRHNKDQLKIKNLEIKYDSSQEEVQFEKLDLEKLILLQFQLENNQLELEKNKFNNVEKYQLKKVELGMLLLKIIQFEKEQSNNIKLEEVKLEKIQNLKNIYLEKIQCEKIKLMKVQMNVLKLEKMKLEKINHNISIIIKHYENKL
jgi:hypothetical protein